jgi:8-oxo-dGTP pyrophosphatase MutT (NUDIX family)
MRPGGDQVIPRPPTVWVRPNNPFNNLDHSILRSTEMLVERIKKFSTTVQHVPPAPDARASAVLIPMFNGESGPELVFTRRSQDLTNHKGEISFPGGRLDGGESALDAALREAHEEIDLHPKHVEIIGQLTPLNTYVSKSHIVPIIGLLKDKPSLDARNPEVDRVFTVPVVDLVRSDTYVEEQWGEPPNQFRFHFFHLDDETIWGATGRMLYQIISIGLAH